jgi:hypothetical protein
MGEEILLGIKLKDWAWLIGGIITLIGLIKGLLEFIKNNRIKRAEFLEKMIVEFNGSNLFLAKRILDDFWIETEGSSEMSDSDLIKFGSIEKKEKNVLRQLVTDLLRNHADRSVTGNGEHRARQSFDDLLDFFTKLDYYLSLKLISKNELHYFHYYFERCAYKADGAVMQYASTYGYPSLFRLLYVLGIEPKNKDVFEENLKFITNKQQSYFKKLRSNQK